MKQKFLIFGIISGLLFSLTWTPLFKGLNLFIAFIPLIYYQNQYKTKCFDLFKASFIAFLIFHFATVWWIYHSGILSFLVLISLNSLFMAATMAFACKVSEGKNKFFTGMVFITFWISFEFLHFHWELNWPFMQLGKWLGQNIQFVQFYEFTGVLGGSLWVLLINQLIFLSLNNFNQLKSKKGFIYSSLVVIFLIFPIVLSIHLYAKQKENNKKIEVLIVQPNINPYTEKYDKTKFKKQINRQLYLINKNISDSTQIVLLPEASLPLYLNEKKLNEDSTLINLQHIVKSKSFLNILAGLYSYNIINSDTLYYNTYLQINKSGIKAIYHKSKLVPAVEKMPFRKFLSFLSIKNINYGGNSNSLGIDKKRTIFNIGNEIKVAPIICFESLFGTFVAEYINKGANLIVVSTNDGWWGNSPAYKQILLSSQIRAVESRKNIARTSNTGISCIINSKGKIIKQIDIEKENTLTAKVSINNYQSFYTLHGDYIGLLSIIFSIIFILAYFAILLKQDKKA